MRYKLEMKTINRNSITPLSSQIAADLRSKIDRGEFKAGSRLPPEEQLAREYGVSRMTARKTMLALTNEGLIWRAAGKGTFVRDSDSNDSDKRIPERTVAIVVPTLDLSFFHHIICGAECELRKANCHPLLFSTSGDVHEERRYLQKLPRHSAVAGVLLVPSRTSQINAEYIRQLSQDMPLVLVDQTLPGVETDSVNCDNRGGACQAAEHLIELGRKSILHLAGPENDVNAEERLAGYRDALAKHGIEQNPRLIRHTNWMIEDGYNETVKVMLSDLKPDAIFACNDMVAVGALRALRAMNKRVPDDVALAGYGNLDLCRTLEAPLTSVDQSPKEEGRIAAQMILERIAAGRDANYEPRRIRIPTRLVIRDSCGLRTGRSAMGVA